MKDNIAERSWVEIDLAAYSQNLQLLRERLLPGQCFMQIVKADAYGHGAKEIAEAAQKQGAVYLGVANLEEGKLLRIQGSGAPILILSPSLKSEIPLIIKYGLSPAISDLSFAKALFRAAKKAGEKIKVHLKLDTGMHRSGIALDEAPEIYKQIKAMPDLEIEGIFSHFASAENDQEFTDQQEHGFREFIQSLQEAPRYVHISNSAGLLNHYGKFCNLVRLGIASFGVTTTFNEDLPLEPVMTFKSAISQIKKINAKESVGYEREWIAPRDGRYGIIPVGYADGYDFLLSNRSRVLVQGQLCPVIGRISMDMITVDLTDLEEAQPGDEVTLLGNKSEALRAEKLAALYGGSAYELLCQVGRRAKRYYRINDRIHHSAPLARRDFVSSDFGDSKLNQIISSALTQRLESSEIGEMIYREILRTFFYNKDRDIHYRKDFCHDISFQGSPISGYYRAETSLRYRKVLRSDSFIIACAASDEILRGFFLNPNVEYRWLLDAKLSLSEESFAVNKVKVGGIDLKTRVERGEGFLLIHCSHPRLSRMINREIDFEIITTTLYSKSLHQFSVFISDLTKGIDISFSYPKELSHVEPVSIFSGQEKNPLIHRGEQMIRISTKADEWIFPLSGVVFTY